MNLPNPNILHVLKIEEMLQSHFYIQLFSRKKAQNFLEILHWNATDWFCVVFLFMNVLNHMGKKKKCLGGLNVSYSSENEFYQALVCWLSNEGCEQQYHEGFKNVLQVLNQ